MPVYRTDGRKRDRLTRRQLAALLVPPDADGWPLVDEDVPLAPIAYALTEKGLVEPTGLRLDKRDGRPNAWRALAGATPAAPVLMGPPSMFGEGGAP